jgi:hypothetical protein
MEQQVNLYQPILGAEKHLFSARAIGISLAVLAVSLGGIDGFSVWRTARFERALALVEQQLSTQMAMNDRAGATLRPGMSLAELQARAQRLTTDIAARERALDLVRVGAASPTTGFAARLEALGRRQLDGVWLHSIVLGSGEGRLAMQGAAVDPRLIPIYLAALAEEHALDGVRFDTLAIRRAKPDEAPAQLLFEIGAPDLKFPAAETHQ